MVLVMKEVLEQSHVAADVVFIN